MTEESKNTLRRLLDESAEKEINDALTWAQVFEREIPNSWGSMSPYTIASLVYLYKTSSEELNSVGKALCETFIGFDVEEANLVSNRFRFPVSLMYAVVEEWMRTSDIPIVFNVKAFCLDYEIMHAAAARDDLDMVQWLFEYDIPIDIKDRSGKTPLHIAAGAGMMRIARFLLASGASTFSADNETHIPLEVALQTCQYETAELLKPDMFCNLRRIDGETLLMELIRNGLVSQTRYLLQYANFEVLNYSDQNLLHVCAEAGQTQIMGMLLKENISPKILNARDALNQTPLYLAIRQNNTLLVAELLAAGAEITVDARNLTTSNEITSLLREYNPIRLNFNHLRI